MGMKLSRDMVQRILNTPGVVVGEAMASRRLDGDTQIVLPAKMSEKEFTALVIGEAQLHGWLVAHFRSVRVQRADGSTFWQTPVQGDGEGFVDLILVRGKRKLAAELKVGRNKPTAKQAKWLTALAEAGDECYVWRPEMWADIQKVLA